ncbi:hypothetical protein D9M68_571770 [compost metagenome]
MFGDLLVHLDQAVELLATGLPFIHGLGLEQVGSFLGLVLAYQFQHPAVLFEVLLAQAFELIGGFRVRRLDNGRAVVLEHGFQLLLGCQQAFLVGLGQCPVDMLVLVAVHTEQLLGPEHVVGPGTAHLADEVHARNRILEHPLGALLDGEHAHV